MTEISVIVPSYNGRSHLGGCLEAVLAGTAAPERFEIVVVDNGSQDGSAAWLREHFAGVRVVSTGTNLGFTGAVAAGVEAARGDILVLLNNDTRPRREWLERLTGALLEAPPSVATVTGKTVSWHGSRIDFWRGALTFDGHAFQLDFARPVAAVTAADTPAELPFPCGANMAIRREAWHASGGFDPDYFAYTEDVDLGWRLWLAGRDHLYEPSAVIHHRSGATGEGLGIYRRGYLFEKNAFMTVYKNLEEELFRDLMLPVLWTLIHRTWALLEANNAGGHLLARYPFPPREEAEATSPPSGESLARRALRHGPREGLRRLLLRLARALGGPCERLTIHDPRTLEQLRAVRFLMRRLDLLAERRRAVQARRQRSDRDYFGRFPMLRVPTYPGDDRLFATAAFRSWFPNSLELEDRTLGEIGELAPRPE